MGPDTRLLRQAAAVVVVVVSGVMLLAVGQWWFDVGPWRALTPHRFCWQNRPGLVWTTAAAHVTTWVAYWAFPLEIYWLTRRGHLPYPGLSYLLAAFVYACGAGHALDAWNIWTPTYYAAAVIHVVTALVSIAFSIIVAGVVWHLHRHALPYATELREAAALLAPTHPRLANVLILSAGILYDEER